MKKHKIKLLLVSSVFVDRGVERIMTFLYKLLPKDIYEVNILCLRDLAPYADYLNRNTDVRVDVLGMKHNFDFAALFRLYRYLKKHKPDIINFHSFRAALWGRPISKWAKVPVVLYSVHNKWGGAFHRFLDRAVSRCTDAIIPFSLAVKKFIVEEESIKEKYVGNPIYIGIDIDKFSNVDRDEVASLREELGISEDQNVIGFIGNVSEQKGLTYLIDSVGSLKTKFRDLCCLIIGDGPETDNLRSKVARDGLEKHFMFLGQRYDTPNLLHVMKIFVLPSLWEGLPQVIIEALAASCPVVATRVDGTPEIITHKKNGWLIPPASARELTEALDTVLSDNGLREELAVNGFITARDRFDVRSMVDNYDILYRSYLAGKR